MSYDIIETSKVDGEPFFLYEFKRGGEVFRFTSLARPITSGGHVWEPKAISHTGVEQNGNIEKNGVDVTMSVQDEFARQYITFSGEEVTTLTIWRGHEANDVISYWKGRIVSGSASDEEIAIECESVFTSLRRSGVRPRFQRSCRHPLYGPGCNLNLNNYALNFYASNVSSTTVTLSLINSGDVFDPTIYGGGIIQFNGSFRYIVAVGSNSVVMATPLPSLDDAYNEFVDVGGSPITVQLYPGCNRTRVECRDRFNNLNNFGGFPGIPTRNPFNSSVI